MKYKLSVNGTAKEVDVEPDTPLLWVLRDELNLTGTKYGCGQAQCGACTIHVNGSRTFSCQFPVSAAEGMEITTIEGLSENGDHPLQRAWVKEQVPQCGYCQSGMIMAAADLLESNKNPSRDEIVDHMKTNLCRCSTYQRVIAAVQTAAKEVQS